MTTERDIPPHPDQGLRFLPIFRVWLFYVSLALMLVVVLVAVRAWIEVYIATSVERTFTRAVASGQVVFAVIVATSAACGAGAMRYVAHQPTTRERAIGRLLAIPFALAFIAWPALTLYW